MFIEKDLQLFNQKGISKETIDGQIQRFEQGFPHAQLTEAATVGNGIIRFDQQKVNDYIVFYDRYASEFDFLKFVPASGAASRMFKDLFEFKDAFLASNKSIDILNDKHFAAAKIFFQNIKEFAFYAELVKVLTNNSLSIDELLQDQKYDVILDYFLESKGLNYAKLPKAMLLFHSYEKANRLAMEEHLVEGANYIVNNQGEVKLHFTVSPEHKAIFEKELNTVLPQYAEYYGISYEISFSVQKSSTDTIAVDLENKPFRESNGEVLFRPAGHGALIENLNDLDVQMVFIKNIDNVVPDSKRKSTITYKKVIGAHLIKLQKQAFTYLEMMDATSFDQVDLETVVHFVSEDLMVKLSEGFNELAPKEKLYFLKRKINRPIRVCGMVKNEGEPGGGPFWLRSHGEESLQIVESSQINMQDINQKQILAIATHFNPVDLVCSLRNYKNEAFDLLEFVDHDTGFISEKSKNGKKLKAQELPGLWNGAMADWNTIFVEVPIETFNPVKTINDLLRLQHLST